VVRRVSLVQSSLLWISSGSGIVCPHSSFHFDYVIPDTIFNFIEGGGPHGVAFLIISPLALAHKDEVELIFRHSCLLAKYDYGKNCKFRHY
jgi:hypothetical protein